MIQVAKAYALFFLGYFAMVLFLPHSVWNWCFTTSEKIQGDGFGPWVRDDKDIEQT